MSASRRVDQLRIYTDLVAETANAAFHYIANTQVSGNVLHIDCLPFVSETGITGNYKETWDL